MISIDEKSNCCGCEACMQICPVNCISMEYDHEGFKYPSVDTSKCVECNRCVTVCPELKDSMGDCTRDIVNFYIAKCLDKDSLVASSSGGVFSVIASYVISNNGIVFGAAFDENWLVHHVAVDSIHDLYLLKGSKYIQSSTDGAFRKVETELLKNRLVLYSGTACQISGLKSFLGKDYDNLLTIDVLCHGVPSSLIWKRYLNDIQSEYHSVPNSISFRDKSISWDDFSIAISFDNGEEYKKRIRQDPYMQLFLKNAILRPSCYDCSFKNGLCHSDITLGDAWGVKNINPELYDKKGLSIVIANSNKGERLLNSIKPNIECYDVPYKEYLDRNWVYYKSVSPHPNREKVMNQFAQGKSISSLAKIIEEPIWVRSGRKIKRVFKSITV